MKRFWTWILGASIVLLLVLSSGTARAFDVPPAAGAVTDTAGVLTAADDAALEKVLARHRARTGDEIGVLVIPTLDGQSIEDVAHTTFDTWGVGKRGVDNGILLVIAVKERRTRIETGKGIGDRLTDLGAAHILADTLAPSLKHGRYREGIERTVDAIIRESAPGRARVARDAGGGASIVLVLCFAAIVAFPIALIMLSRRQRRRLSADPHAVYVAPAYPSTFDASSTTAASTASFGGGCPGGGGASGGF